MSESSDKKVAVQEQTKTEVTHDHFSDATVGRRKQTETETVDEKGSKIKITKTEDSESRKSTSVTTTKTTKSKKVNLVSTNVSTESSRAVLFRFSGKMIKHNPYDLKKCYPKSRYDKNIHDRQRALLTLLKAPKSQIPDILERAKKVYDQLDNDEDELKALIDVSYQSNDQLALVPLQSLFLQAYNDYEKKEGKEEVVANIVTILCFTSQFSQADYTVRDAAIEAYDAAERADKPLSDNLVLIAQAMSADFVDREVLLCVSDYLLSSNDVGAQRVRWIFLNIEKNQVIDSDDVQPSLEIERSIEIPDLAESPIKPVKPETPHKLINKIRKCSINIYDALVAEGDKGDASHWAKYFTPMKDRFSELDESYSDEKVIRQKEYLETLEQDLERFSSISTKINSKLQGPTEEILTCTRKLKKFLILVTPAGGFTIQTACSELNEAQNALRTIIKQSGDPLFISRNAIIDMSLTKVRSDITNPESNDENYVHHIKVLNKLIDSTDDADVGDPIERAVWQLSTENISRSSVVVTLQKTSRYLHICSESLSKYSPDNDEEQVQQLQTFTQQWSEYVEKCSATVNNIANDVEPNNIAHAQSLIDIRTSFDNIHYRSTRIHVKRESDDVVEYLERSISLIQGKPYQHVCIFSSSELAPPPVQGHVSFIEETPKEEEEEIPQSFYPIPIPHPCYESWDPDTFSSFAKLTKSVPFDSAMLRNVTTSKLARSRMSRSRTAGSGVPLGFRQLMLKPLKEITVTKDAESTDEYNEQTIKSAKLELTTIIQSRDMAEEMDFVERHAPLLQACLISEENDPSAKEYETIIDQINNIITDIADEPYFLLPRPAASRCEKRLTCLIKTLSMYKEFESISSDTQITTSIEKWIDYLSDAEHVFVSIHSANDEIAILAAKSFFIQFRSGFASFAQQAETLDSKVSRRSLSTQTLNILKLLESLIKFDQNVTTSELCTISDAQNQLSELAGQIQMADGLQAEKEMFNAIHEQISAMLESSGANTSTADDASQKLIVVHRSLETHIKIADSEEYQIFSTIIGVRYSLKNLHVSDADVDSKLVEMAEAAESDFTRLISHIDSQQSTKRKQTFIKQWVSHMNECQHDITGIRTVASTLCTQSITRYEIIAENAELIYKSLTILENKHFPITVTPYNKLSNHLDKIIDYAKNQTAEQTKSKGSRRFSENQFSTSFTQQLRSLQTKASSFGELDEYYAPFADGFTKAHPEALKSQISDNITSSMSEKSSQINIKIIQELGKLFSAHVDAFTRNYNICNKSTRVCYELQIEFCDSILQIFSVVGKVIKSKKIRPLQKAVQIHIEAISQIQNQYNDKSTYSDFGRKRLNIFAHFCCILAEITGLNIFHLSSQEEQYEFKEINDHVKASSTTFHSLTEYKTRKVYDELRTIEQTSNNLLDEENVFHIISILEVEAKFCHNLKDLIEKMMQGADVRYWKIENLEEPDSSSVVVKPDRDSEKVPSSSLKRNLDIVTDMMHQFKQTLVNGDVQERDLLMQIDAFDSSTKMLSENAVAVDGTDEFFDVVQRFRTTSVCLVNYLRHELQMGTYTIYSHETNSLMKEVTDYSVELVRHLGHMEQLESDDEDAFDKIILRLVKLLMLARDELKETVSIIKISAIPELGYSISSCYDVIIAYLLTLKNCPARITRKIKEKKEILKTIVFDIQELLSAGATIQLAIKEYETDRTESPEFLFKANIEPIVEALKGLKRSIPPVLPNSGLHTRNVAAIIGKLTIIMEPQYEERPLLEITA